MATKKATVVQVVKPQPAPAPSGPRKVKHYGVACVRIGNIVEIRPFVPKEMK